MMKSLLKKWLPGILAVGLMTLAVGAAGVSTATAADAQISALTKAQKKAKAKALKACKKKKNAKQRKSCAAKVNKKYKKLANKKPKGKTWKVGVFDNYFTPNNLNIKVNDSVQWLQEVAGREPHNASPTTVPKGVNRADFTIDTFSVGVPRSRQFTKAGKYSFICTFHVLMTMDVNVKK